MSRFANILAIFLCAGLSAWPQTAALTQAELLIQDAIQSGDLASASRLVAQSLKQFPRAGGLLNLRGVISARQERIADARNDFAEAVRLAPNLTPAWQNLARACRSLAATPCATDSWRHVLSLKAGDEEALSSLALLDAQASKFTESLRELEKLPAEASHRPPALLLRCLDLSFLARSAEAAKLASNLSSNDDFSEADLDAVASLLDNPSAADVTAKLLESLDTRRALNLANLQRLALADEQLHRIEDARRILDRAALLDPGNPVHLLELARLAELTKDHEGALSYLAHARDLTPDNPQIHFLFGVIAAEMELPIEARASLQRAIALKPDDPSYNYAMGSVLLNTRDALSAAKFFQKFIALQPADPRGPYALGIAYFAAGDYDDAKREMLGVESDPKARAGANYFLGRMARSDGEVAEAARRLRQSIQLMPDFSESHTELARVLMDQDNFEEARTEIARALQLDPNSFQGNNQLLVLYRRVHDPRGDQQAELLKKLDQDRSKRAELMLRTIEARP